MFKLATLIELVPGETVALVLTVVVATMEPLPPRIEFKPVTLTAPLPSAEPTVLLASMLPAVMVVPPE